MYMKWIHTRQGERAGIMYVSPAGIERQRGKHESEDSGWGGGVQDQLDI